MTKAIKIYFWIFVVSLFSFLLGYNLNEPDVLVYQVDSWGGQVIGVVDDKYQVGESYNLVIDGDYFSVNKEQYQAAKVGDTVIGFLNKGE